MLTEKVILRAGYGIKKGKRVLRAGYGNKEEKGVLKAGYGSKDLKTFQFKKIIFDSTPFFNKLWNIIRMNLDLMEFILEIICLKE